MGILIIVLFAGPVGNYLGYTYQFYLGFNGKDSLYTILGDPTMDPTVYDTIIVIDTFRYNNYPAYSLRRVRYSDVLPLNSTTMSYEKGDSMFGSTILGDIQAKLYVIPFVVNNQWDPGVTGETLIVDIDNDDILDTLVIQSASITVVSQEVVSVPLGTFNTYKLRSVLYLRGKQSYGGGLPCRIWARDYQWMCPYVGMVKDSIHIIDSVLFFFWLKGAEVFASSKANGYGWIAIAEKKKSDLRGIFPTMNGVVISGSGHYTIEIYDALGRLYNQWRIKLDDGEVKRLKLELNSGIYFARIKENDMIITTKKITVIR
ncbi:MAG: T9SS type A sorting domain-containing protein [candidate division WOR-3 bacterium]